MPRATRSSKTPATVASPKATPKATPKAKKLTKTVKRISLEKIVEVPKVARAPLEPIAQMISDTLHKIINASLTEPFIEKLEDYYKNLDPSKRQIFQRRLVLELQKCFCHLHEINSKKTKKARKISSDPDVDQVLRFIVDLLNKLNLVELEHLADSQNCTVIEVDSVVTTILESLVTMLDVKSNTIKIKAAEMIGSILHTLSDEAEILEYLIDKLIEALCNRTRDRNCEVRMSALRALNRLQDFRNPEDEVIRLYCMTMQTDENDDCRRIATSLCGLNKYTLLRILDRCQDIASSVRVAAYKRIAGKVKLSVLKHDQVLSLIEKGLADNSEDVRNVLKDNLIPAWLQHVKNKNGDQGGLIDFIAMIDPTTSLITAMKTVNCILTPWNDLNELMNHCLTPEQNLVNENMLPAIVDDYGPAVAFTWYHLCDYFKEKDAEVLKEFLPGLPSFCQIIISQLSELKELTITPSNDESSLADQIMVQENSIFICNWLLKSIKFFDVFDPTSRCKLHDLATELLLKVPSETFHQLSENIFEVAKKLAEVEMKKVSDIIKEWIETLREGETKVNETTEVMETSARSEDIAIPLEIQIKLMELERKLSDISEGIDIAVEMSDFPEAQRLKEEKLVVEEQVNEMKASKVQQKKLDKPTATSEEDNESFNQESATKALILLVEYLKTKRNSFDIGLEQFIKILIIPVLPGIINLTKANIPVYEEVAINCLGLFSSLDKDIAKKYTPLLLIFAENQTGEVKMKTQEFAIKSICDIALIYPSDLTDEVSTDDISQHLSETTFDCKDGLQTTVARVCVDISKNDNLAEEIKTAAIEAICRLMLSGRSSAALFVSLVLFILKKECDKKECSKYKRVVHILMLSKSTHAILDDAFYKTLMVLLLSKEIDIEFDRTIDFFAKISNPEAITKVLKQHGKNLDEVYDINILPLKLVNKSLEILESYPNHPLAFVVCRTLETFNITPVLEQALQHSFSNDIGIACRDHVYLCEELIEKCRNVIRERRIVKVLDDFRKIIASQVIAQRAAERKYAENMQKDAETKSKEEISENLREINDSNKRTAPETVTSQSETETEKETESQEEK